MSKRFFFVAFCVAIVVAEPAFARPPLARRTIGRIDAVNVAQRRLTIRSECRNESMTLTFDRSTRIWNGREEVPAHALTRGQFVEVTYRTPLFSSDYASRIALRSPTQSPKNKPLK